MHFMDATDLKNNGGNRPEDKGKITLEHLSKIVKLVMKENI